MLLLTSASFSCLWHQARPIRLKDFYIWRHLSEAIAAIDTATWSICIVWFIYLWKGLFSNQSKNLPSFEGYDGLKFLSYELHRYESEQHIIITLIQHPHHTPWYGLTNCICDQKFVFFVISDPDYDDYDYDYLVSIIWLVHNPSDISKLSYYFSDDLLELTRSTKLTKFRQASRKVSSSKYKIRWTIHIP